MFNPNSLKLYSLTTFMPPFHFLVRYSPVNDLAIFFVGVLDWIWI